MNGLKLLLLIVTCSVITEAVPMPVPEIFHATEAKLVTSFIRRLIREEKSKDLHSVCDVAILRFERDVGGDLFDEIATKISPGNTVIMPESDSTVVGNKIRVASFVIIVSDVTDYVSR